MRKRSNVFTLGPWVPWNWEYDPAWVRTVTGTDFIAVYVMLEGSSVVWETRTIDLFLGTFEGMDFPLDSIGGNASDIADAMDQADTIAMDFGWLLL